MKIIHISQYYNPGFGYQENILPQYQKALGHEVAVITSTRSNGFNKSGRNYLPGEVIENGIRIIRIPICGELKDKFVFFKNLDTYLENEAPDYIFHHMPTALSLLALRKYKNKHPKTFIAIDNHADRSISVRNKLIFFVYYRVIFRLINRMIASSVDLYFGVTPARCLFLEEELGINRDKIRLLPIGSSFTSEADMTKAESPLDKFQLDQNLILMVHGGKITPDKHVDRIVTAFKMIQRSDVRLILFGSIEDPEVESLIQDDNRIIFLGWLDRQDTMSVLASCSFGIWNSRHTTLLEDALAAGLPMILRYYGSTSHLIDQSGLFLFNDTPVEILDRIQLLLNYPELLAKLKINTEKHRENLSYLTIAKESISYSQDTGIKPIHAILMKTIDQEARYDYFRELNHD